MLSVGKLKTDNNKNILIIKLKNIMDKDKKVPALGKTAVSGSTGSKNKLPKSIYSFRGKYKVVFHSKTEKETINAGLYDDLQMAIAVRDVFIKKHINDVLKGYLPRGITYVEKTNKYESRFVFQEKYTVIGYYDTLDEAVMKRNSFIDSLK